MIEGAARIHVGFQMVAIVRRPRDVLHRALANESGIGALRAAPPTSALWSFIGEGQTYPAKEHRFVGHAPPFGRLRSLVPWPKRRSSVRHADP
jgi:hypothetical protein